MSQSDFTLPSNSSKQRKRRQQKDAGFTLVELLVVLVILGLIVGIAAPQVMRYLGSSRTNAATIQIERLGGILDLYRLDTGTYPESGSGLDALITAPAGANNWNGPYLRNEEALIDPWGKPYLYRFPGENAPFDVYSLGADGQQGGDGENADIGL